MSDTPHLFLAPCCRAVHPPPVPACCWSVRRYSLPHHLLHSPFAQVCGTPARHPLAAGQDQSVPGSLLHRLFFRLPMGHWTRANAEICSLAVRGHPKRQAKDVHQVIISHVEEHSKKPDEVRERIERLMGDVPRIELFARQKADGWDVWGNEVINDVELTT